MYAIINFIKKRQVAVRFSPFLRLVGLSAFKFLFETHSAYTFKEIKKRTLNEGQKETN